MRAIRLHTAGIEGLELDEVATPQLQEGEALVRVHAAAITRDELDWPTDRLPAVPSYELSGVVVAAAPGVDGVATGDEVYALTPFDRDGVAADFAAVPAELLAPKPTTLDHVRSAAVPLPGLSAWQALFDHGRLEAGQRVLITGATGGVGHFAVQLARQRGAHVMAVVSSANADRARALGAQDVLLQGSVRFESLGPVDLVFDTAGGELLRAAAAAGCRIVSIAEEPPAGSGTYFVVEPNRGQLVELARLADAGELQPEIDSVFSLTDARGAFQQSMARGKHGKVVLRVSD
jgi:NADPH:quinone reductase-like Zn-dependent oxidoreductase